MPGNEETSAIDPIVLDAAAKAIREADALLIAAGAGMGVDSGLPDFRGTQGFWRAYPAFEKLGLRFEQLANPIWFDRDPAVAWGFYGHRLQVYRDTTPHSGFSTIIQWCKVKPGGCFVFTSNVDGQFQKAGFDEERIVECHGSIHNGQCATPCCDDIWPLRDVIRINAQTIRAEGVLPSCSACGRTARPNVLMFGDSRWIPDRSDRQSAAYRQWLSEVRGHRVALVEFGAGSAVPSVRHESERLAASLGAKLVRINPREPKVPHGHFGLPCGARMAVEEFNRRM